MNQPPLNILSTDSAVENKHYANAPLAIMTKVCYFSSQGKRVPSIMCMQLWFIEDGSHTTKHPRVPYRERQCRLE